MTSLINRLELPLERPEYDQRPEIKGARIAGLVERVLSQLHPLFNTR